MAEKNKTEKKVVKQEERLSKERQKYLNDLFNDIYANRKRIYRVNFFRGIFFGFGTFLGGTVVVALVIWLLNQFSDPPAIQKLIDVLTGHL